MRGRDEAWKEQTIANTSEAQFEQEYGNSFLGTGNTLINSNTLLGLKAYDPEWSKEEFYMYQKPVEGHQYVMCCDVAKEGGLTSQRLVSLTYLLNHSNKLRHLETL